MNVFDNTLEYNRQAIGYHPSICCIPICNSQQGNSMQGVKIGSRYILTAAHVAPPAGTNFIILGKDSRRRRYARTISKVHFHPAWLAGVRNADLAILEMSSPWGSLNTATASLATEVPCDGSRVFAYHKDYTVTEGEVVCSGIWYDKSSLISYSAIVFDGLNAVMGDSGHPIFLFPPTPRSKPRLLSVFSGTSVGSLIPCSLKWINSIIKK